MERPFAAVLLDFGGTLFSYRDFSRHTLELIAAAAGRLGGPPASDLQRAALAYRDASRSAFEQYFGRPYYLHRDLFHETFRRFARALGAQPTLEFLDWFHEAQRALVVERFELRPGARETLERLRAAGLHVAIVSNIDDDYLEPMIERAGLAGVLHGWTSSEQARSCKPDPRIFQLALEKAGAAPGEVLFVGDSPEHDIAGARAAGMRAALLREQGAQPPGSGAGPAGEPHYTIDSLPELLGIVGAGEAPDARAAR